MDFELLQLIILFAFIAILYSSAGFGGGSSYLAVLALFETSFSNIRMLALLCNITVVAGSVILLYRNKHLNLKKTIPLIILSIPMAYLGGRFKISQNTFFIILGISLLAASIIMFFFNPKESKSNQLEIPHFGTGLIGGAIGLLSGIVGIGGGIFLSPILHFSRWAAVKTISAATALFILVNSIAGLIGQISVHGFTLDPIYALSLMLSVFIGGQIGVRLSIHKLSPDLIKKITAILIFLVAIRVLYY